MQLFLEGFFVNVSTFQNHFHSSIIRHAQIHFPTKTSEEEKKEGEIKFLSNFF